MLSKHASTWFSSTPSSCARRRGPPGRSRRTRRYHQRLSPGRKPGRRRTGHNRCQQHYLPHLDSSPLIRFQRSPEMVLLFTLRAHTPSPHLGPHASFSAGIRVAIQPNYGRHCNISSHIFTSSSQRGWRSFAAIVLHPWGAFVAIAPHIASSRERHGASRPTTHFPLRTQSGGVKPVAEKLVRAGIILACNWSPTTSTPIPRGGRCRVRVHLLDEDVDGPVVVCFELPTNECASVTNAFEQLAAAQVRERPRCCGGDSLGGEEAGTNERGGPQVELAA